MHGYLAALPPWLGSKRSNVREILAAIRAEGCGPEAVLADPFLSGGSLAMAAKVLGYEVHGNDTSPISVAIGKGLIENGTRTLYAEERDLALTAAYGRAKIPAPKQLALPDRCRQLLAGMVACEHHGGHPNWLMRVWIAKTALTMATWGIPTVAAGSPDWDELTPGQAQQLKRTGRPMGIAKKTFDAVNLGVHDNGRANTMRQGDPIEFLQDVRADVVYVDPPHPERDEVYAGVSQLLEAEVEGATVPSLEQIFDAADAIPLVVVSLGRGADAEGIAELMSERGREITWRSLGKAEALKKPTDVEGDELLLVGRKKG